MTDIEKLRLEVEILREQIRSMRPVCEAARAAVEFISNNTARNVLQRALSIWSKSFK